MHAEDDQVPITGSDRRSASTIVAHDGDFPFGAVVPPIYQTSLFTYANYAELAGSFAGELTRPIYSRGDNPTVMEFEAKIAALEGAEAARPIRPRSCPATSSPRPISGSISATPRRSPRRFWSCSCSTPPFC